MEEIPITILQRFDEIYQKLSHEEGLVALPAREMIMNSVKRCSFRMFDESDEYVGSERAKEHPHSVSPTFSHAFRVYFNSYSKKIYVDLNRDSMTAIRITLETEAQILCDIIRSILSVDPYLSL